MTSSPVPVSVGRHGRALDRQLLVLGIPALGALSVEPLYAIVDTAIVGRLGRGPLGGLAIATVVLSVFVFGCGFLMMATTPRIASARGAGDHAAMARTVVAAYTIAFGLGATIGVVLWVCATPISRALGAEGDVLRAAVTYLRWSSLGIPFALALLAGTGHQRGLGNTKATLAVVVAANVANVVAEVVLVDVAHAGVAGSAIGTVAAQVGAGTWMLWSSARLVRRTGASLRASPAEMRALGSIGVVLVVRTVALVSVMVGSVAVVGRLGSAALGGHQLGRQMFLLTALCLDAVAVPAQVLIPLDIGAGRIEDAVAVARRVLGVSIRAGLVVGPLLALAAPLLVRLFTSDPQVRHAGVIAIVACGLSQPFAGAAFALDGIIVGTGQVAVLRRAMLIATVAVAPMFALIALHPSLGIGAVWTVLGLWLVIRCALLWRAWLPAIERASVRPNAG